MTNQPRGFILVVSVLVLSTILVVIGIATAFGIAGVQNRALEIETQIAARALAEACAEAALMELRLDDAYAGNETKMIGGASCTIRPIQPGPPAILETEATSSGSVYRLRIEISDVANLTITKWQRVSSY
jgi:Tfp pilus assembly protein PilX